MKNDLYFVPVLARALGQPEAKIALALAFDEIKRLGQLPEYQRGYRQFQEFMALVQAAAVSAHKPDDSILRRQSGQEPLGGLFPSAELQGLREQLTAELDSVGMVVTVLIHRDDAEVGRVTLTMSQPDGNLDGILPGLHTFALESGRVLGEARWTEDDLLWTRAYPGRALELAASTSAGAQVPVREIAFLVGELLFRVYPGLETGRLGIQWRRGQAHGD